MGADSTIPSTNLSLLLGAVACTLAGGVAACGAEAPPRSVILVSLDTLRADHTGLHGYERETTPYLERLAGESLVFERAFSPASWTLISHMTMFTGLYPAQHGVVHRDLALSPDSPTLAERLRERGFRTIGLYYEGVLNERPGFGRGFDVFRPHETAEEAQRHLDEELAELDREQPFFLFLHLFDIHAGPLDREEPGPVYEQPAPYDEMFLPGAAARLPKVPEIELWKAPFRWGEREREALVALYDGGIRYVDDRLREWVEGWRSAGLLDETLLIVTSDHGESLAQRGFVRFHGGLYQEGLHVPLLIRHPHGLRAGERESATAHHVDLVPTVLEWTDGEPPAGTPGRSLFRPIPADRTVLAWDERYYKVLVRWPEKLVWMRYPPGHARSGEQAYLRFDLERDPAELAPEEIDEAEFRARLEGFAPGRAAGHPAAVVTNAEDPSSELYRKLQGLGYVDGEPQDDGGE